MKHFSDDGCNVTPPYDSPPIGGPHVDTDLSKDYEFSVFHHDEEYDPMKDYEFSIFHHDEDFPNLDD